MIEFILWVMNLMIAFVLGVIVIAMIAHMIAGVLAILWFITGRCYRCGGKTTMESLRYEYCNGCGRRV